MRRITLKERPQWRERCEAVGFGFHSIDGVYWEDGVAYEFTEDEIDHLDDASNACHQLCLQAVDHIIEKQRFKELGIPEPAWSLIRESWQAQDPYLYGRFDMIYDGQGPAKLLEYNADTPTGLVESAVAQWHWLEEQIQLGELPKHADQFNSVHEKLIARWQHIKPRLRSNNLHFTCIGEHEEDEGNLHYLRDTAMQAGLLAPHIAVEHIGWSDDDAAYFDQDNLRIHSLFKLYPWEWLLGDAFGQHLRKTDIQIIEPIWKMLLANKGLLPILWELFPQHENLLPASFHAGQVPGSVVKKPLLSREGGNISIYDARGLLLAAQDGAYGAEGYVYQAYAPVPCLAPKSYMSIGSWVIGDEAAGIGLREDESPITKNTSRFVPHYFI
ncbi:MAG: hypothetical protein RLZZ502_696 [Pseudomonadota bacterium]